MQSTLLKLEEVLVWMPSAAAGSSAPDSTGSATVRHFIVVQGAKRQYTVARRVRRGAPFRDLLSYLDNPDDACILKGLAGRRPQGELYVKERRLGINRVTTAKLH